MVPFVSQSLLGLCRCLSHHDWPITHSAQHNSQRTYCPQKPQNIGANQHPSFLGVNKFGGCYQEKEKYHVWLRCQISYTFFYISKTFKHVLWKEKLSHYFKFHVCLSVYRFHYLLSSRYSSLSKNCVRWQNPQPWQKRYIPLPTT